MSPVSSKTRLLHFAGGLFYLAFFCVIYSLPATNLHSLHSKKDFIVGFIFPAILFVLLIVRLFSRRYPSSLLLLFVAKGDAEAYETRSTSDRLILAFLNFIAFLLPVTLISFDLKEAGLREEGYSPTLLWACIGVSAIAFISVMTYFMKEKEKSIVAQLTGAVIFAGVMASVAWWAVCEAYVIYEMVFLHPELFRI